MSVVATLVLGADGSSTKNGSSEALSTAEDRERFLLRRKNFDVLVIGANTARNERYLNTPVPLVVISHSRPEILDLNDNAHWFNCTPREGLSKARLQFGDQIGIEAGWRMVKELLEDGAIDEFELSVSPVTDGENLVDLDYELRKFDTVSKFVVNETTFFSCSRYNGHT